MTLRFTSGAASSSAPAAGRAGVPGGRLAGLAWIALLGSGLGVLGAAGRGLLAGPPLTSPWRWLGWLHARPPATAAFALLRLAGLGPGGPGAAAARRPTSTAAGRAGPNVVDRGPG